MTQLNPAGVEENVGTLGRSDFFGEIALLFDRWGKGLEDIGDKIVKSSFQAESSHRHIQGKTVLR